MDDAGRAPMTKDLSPFLQDAAAIMAAHDSAIGRRLAAHLERARPAEAPPAGAAHPALGSLARLAPGPLVEFFVMRGDRLPWRKPGFGTLPDAVADRIAVVEILGPTGVIFDEEIRFGALLQGASVRYPAHAHAAEELYYVVSGEARWSLDDEPPRPRGEGAYIHHPSWRPHGIDTGREPILALWGWAGDISGASYRLVASAG